MSDFIVYNPDGEILRTGSCPQSMINAQAKVGETAIEGSANDETQYVDPATQIVTDKPVMGASIDKTTCLADGVDSVTISNLPNPVTVTIDGATYSVTDGVFEITFDTPGDYEIVCKALNRLDSLFTVTAT